MFAGFAGRGNKKAAAKRVCEECEGEGGWVEEDRQKCKNCDGVGSMVRGGSRLACSACGGAGEHVNTKQVTCRRCAGSGKASEAPPPPPTETQEVIGKGEADEDDEDPEIVEVEEREEGTDKKPKPKAKSKAQAKKKARRERDDDAPQTVGSLFGIDGHVAWDAKDGLIIDLILSRGCLSNTVAFVALITGFVLLGQTNMVYYVLGVVLAGGGFLSILYINLVRLKPMFQQLAEQVQSSSRV